MGSAVPGLEGNFFTRGSSRKASTSASFTLGKMRFWSTVTRTMPPQYLSARAAAKERQQDISCQAHEAGHFTRAPQTVRKSCKGGGGGGGGA